MAKSTQPDFFQYANLALGGLAVANLQEIKQAHRQEVAALESMSGHLHGIQHEMNNLREGSEEGLAIQQELLNRENIQAMLEEFIFQLEEMLKEFQKPKNQYPPATQYFMLRGVLEIAQKEGIKTPIIRGREEKLAFKKAMETAYQMYKSLRGHKDVKDAIAWINQENARQRDIKASQRKKEMAIRRKEMAIRRREIENRLSQLESDLAHLKSGKISLGFIDWYQEKIANPVHDKIPIPKWLIHVAIWYLGSGFLWLYPTYHFSVVSKNQHLEEQQKELLLEKKELRQESTELNKSLP